MIFMYLVFFGVIGFVLYDWFSFQFGLIDEGTQFVITKIFTQFKSAEYINTTKKMAEIQTWVIVIASLICVLDFAVIPLWFYSSYNAAVNDYEFHHSLVLFSYLSPLVVNPIIIIAGIFFTNKIDKDRYLLGKLDKRMYK
jgi:hypothetical protein